MEVLKIFASNDLDKMELFAWAPEVMLYTIIFHFARTMGKVTERSWGGIRLQLMNNRRP